MVWSASKTALQQALQKTDIEALRLKAYAVQARLSMAAGNVSGNAILQTAAIFQDGIAVWNEAKGLTGIAQYAADQKDVPIATVVADFEAMETAALAIRDLVIATFPKNASGKMNYRTLNADASISTDAFTPAQTATLRDRLADFEVTIG